MSQVNINNLTKSFGNTEVLHQFSHTIQDGQFVTLLGPSGCGKTTILRIIAGFERPTTGSVSIGDRIVSDEKTFVPPEKRDIGMVFQSYAVWPHMNVYDNIIYPLKIKKTDKKEIEKRAQDVLDIVHLTAYKDRMPDQLSGGQQQRVALGRALIAQPDLLLLDEPLSNLDAKLREKMRYEIKEIQQQLGITVVYVTHDQIEAMTMSDQIILIDSGTVQQIGTPTEIYTRPTNPFVANFVGRVDFLPGKVHGERIRLEGTDQALPYNGPLCGKVLVAIRPENIRFSDKEPNLKGVLQSKFFLGEANDCRVKVGEHVLRVMEDAMTFNALSVGQNITMHISDFFVFPDDGQDYLRITT